MQLQNYPEIDTTLNPRKDKQLDWKYIYKCPNLSFGTSAGFWENPSGFTTLECGWSCGVCVAGAGDGDRWDWRKLSSWGSWGWGWWWWVWRAKWGENCCGGRENWDWCGRAKLSFAKVCCGWCGGWSCWVVVTTCAVGWARRSRLIWSWMNPALCDKSKPSLASSCCTTPFNEVTALGSDCRSSVSTPLAISWSVTIVS